MKSLVTYLLITILFCACKKDTTYPEITGTVISQSATSSNFALVEIDNPGSQLSYSFFCENIVTTPPIGHFDCGNSIYIINLPASLKVNGLKIAFSKYKNLGPNPIWSATNVPRDVEVYDARVK